MKKLPVLLVILNLFYSLISCKTDESQIQNSIFEANGLEFENNGIYPQKYTCDGQSISPAIEWKGEPPGTKSFAITMHHFPPTGEKHVYMVVYNIPPNTKLFPENSTNLGIWGINTVNNKNGYAPPCSQGPGLKSYILTVYALSEIIPSFPAGTKVSMDVLIDTMKGRILNSSIINVNYARP